MGEASDQERHRLDGFDPDAGLERIRELARQLRGVPGAGIGAQLAEQWDLLDHWLILGCEPPAEWRWPEPGLVAERVMRRQPKRTTRARRR
jgi:hypothetical protein